MKAAKPKQGASQLNQPKVIECILVVTNQYGAAFGEPTHGPLHDPSPWLVPRIFPFLPSSVFLLTDGANVWRVPILCGRPVSCRIVIAFVQA